MKRSQPPSVNRSAVEFEVDEGRILYALAAVKGVGRAAVEHIVDVRGDRPFKSLADFEPEQVVDQIEPLRKLLEARQKLADLRNKMAGNDKFEDLLNEVLQNTDKIAQLGREVGGDKSE